MKTYEFLVTTRGGEQFHSFDDGYSAQEAAQGIWLRFPDAVKVEELKYKCACHGPDEI